MYLKAWESDQKQAESGWESMCEKRFVLLFARGTFQSAHLMKAESHRQIGLRYQCKAGRAAGNPEREGAAKGMNPKIYTLTAPKFLANC